jgi:hypothetical protein
MADEVRDYLTSEIETLRSAVFRAGALNAKTLGPCAEAHLDTVLHFVIPSPDLEEATYFALARTAVLARALYAQAQIAEIEEARRHALAAIDAFAVVVDGALRAGALGAGARLAAGAGEANGAPGMTVRACG